MADDSSQSTNTSTQDAPSPGPIHARLIVLPPDLVSDKVNLPPVDAKQYVLLDNDAANCRVIGDDELNASYIDRNVQSYVLDGIEVWPAVPNPDNHSVILTYTNGSTNTIALNSISLDPGPAPTQYYKANGVITPIDDSGTALLDATNTPNLTYIRNQYWDMARKQVETNVYMAQIVATFASAVAAGGNQNASGLKDYTDPGTGDGSSSSSQSAPADGSDGGSSN